MKLVLGSTAMYSRKSALPRSQQFPMLATLLNPMPRVAPISTSFPACPPLCDMNADRPLGSAVIQKIEDGCPWNAGDHQVHRPRNRGEAGPDLHAAELIQPRIDGIDGTAEIGLNQSLRPERAHLPTVLRGTDQRDGTRIEDALEFRQPIASRFALHLPFLR